MKNSTFHFFLVFLIVGFSVLGYASYRTIEFNFPTSTASADATNVPEIVQAPVVVPEQAIAPINSPSAVVSTGLSPSEQPQTASALSPERKALVDALTQLVTDDIRMKIGSKGTRVGTVQKFINLYENKNSKVDNKYGEGLKKSVAAFQAATGDEADGLADPGTYQKMIEWLKNN